MHSIRQLFIIRQYQLILILLIGTFILTACTGTAAQTDPVIEAASIVVDESPEQTDDAEEAEEQTNDSDETAEQTDDSEESEEQMDDAEEAEEQTNDSEESAEQTGDSEEPEEQPNAGPPPATMTELSDGVYHYFGGFYSSLVVVTDEGVLITDTANPMRAAELQAAIAELTDQPVTHIVLTHEHYDHVGGTELFADAEIVCHVICNTIFQIDEYGLAPSAVDTSFETFLAIELGGKTVELHHIAPGDGVGTTVIYMPEEQVVVSSDLYSPQALTNGAFMNDQNLLGIRAILNEVGTWELAHAITAHAPGTDPQDLRDAAAYYDDLFNAINEQLGPVMTEQGFFAAFGFMEQLKNELKLPQYAEWEGYDEFLPAHIRRMSLSLIHGG